jgi:hypothetical protein
MVQYDDAATDGAIRIYDRGLDFTEPSNFGEYRLTYRSGDMVAPRLEADEPLGLELEDFARAIRTRTPPRSHAALGVEIVRVLEAAHRSLSSSGQPVALRPAASQPSLEADWDTDALGILGADGTRDFTVPQAAQSGDPTPAAQD